MEIDRKGLGEAMVLDYLSRNDKAFAVQDGVNQIDFPTLVERSYRVYSLLRKCGVGPGDHVALLLDNRYENVEIMLGVLLSGAWLTPINWHLAPPEVEYIVADSAATTLFYSASLFEQKLSGSAVLEQLRLAIDLEADYPSKLAEVSLTKPAAADTAGGLMIYTSGTTGYPKGVKRVAADCLETMLSNMRQGGHHVGLDGEGVHLVTGPMYHAAPALYAIYDLLNGASLYLMQKFDVREALVLIERYGVTHTHWVPTMFVRLLKLPLAERQLHDCSSLRLVLHGAAPISASVKQQMIEAWGTILVEYWGGTEGGVTTLVDSEAWLRCPGTVGQALPQFEVFSVDKQGQRLGANEIGLLYARHRDMPRVFEYHGDAEKTAAAHLSCGAFTLGDLGRVDDDGYVYLSDRRSNLIISGGVNIYPAEIEAVLIDHPAVADAGVFGVPDDEWGEQVVAVIQPMPEGVGEGLQDELMAHCRQLLAAYKLPRQVYMTSKLPRTPAGKLYLRRIRDQYPPRG
ncbi:acyl-CoA synthetase (AMP-forming)/AMP-acid ligase II [Sinobacterium caligoides]|uniref:Acyl-CoA synthetase (AMP-forming)/AMP-acid ligase II n=1 Tax=Sinobacterium caligoides TaxID=933926 RepID=A0A3N2DKT6_9GAMM|nr:AMP-binding protein [Sinobacterium caligoides]ROS00322.1 acyl-CoA synthetase (AMP-forming)/AMP-acid ligase II [Sinobacterium caligoides]